jgi:hypothetical protein
MGPGYEYCLVGYSFGSLIDTKAGVLLGVAQPRTRAEDSECHEISAIEYVLKSLALQSPIPRRHGMK